MSDKYEAIVTADVILRALEASVAGGEDVGWEITMGHSSLGAESNKLLNDEIIRTALIASGLPAEIARLRAEVEQVSKYCETLTQRCVKDTATIGELQAKIDALMLEYCPDEMTPEQIEEWGKRQRRVSPEEEAKINAALAKDRSHD